MSVYLKVRVNIHIQYVNINTIACNFIDESKETYLHPLSSAIAQVLALYSLHVLQLLQTIIFFESYVFIFEGFLVALVRIYLVSSWERREDQALKYLKIEVFSTIIVSDLSR